MDEIQMRAWGRTAPIPFSGARGAVKSQVLGVALLVAVVGLAGEARGQAVETPDDSPSTAEPAPDAEANLGQGQAQPLSLRYRFIERYSDKSDPDNPSLLNEYHVGSREKFKFMRERPQGAPERNETTLQTIYTELVTKLDQKRIPTEVVRRYDKSQFTTTLPLPHFQKPGLFEGLNLVYQLAPGKPVRLFNMSEGRPFRQVEFDEISRNPILPKLASYLSTQPRRVGDVWPVPPPLTSMLISEALVDDPDYDVTGELLEVRAATPGSTTITAVLGFKGQTATEEGPIALNARVHFSYYPVKPAASGTGAARPKKQDGIIDALGYISEIRLAEERTIQTGEGEGRLKQSQTRELVLARRRSSVVEIGSQTLKAVDEALDPLKTWVTYDDFGGAFHLDHPQELRLAEARPQGGDFLSRRPNGGMDVVKIDLVPKTGDASQDRIAADPLERKKLFIDYWKSHHLEVLMGAADWLKDPAWASSNRKVYRFEAALKGSDDEDATGKASPIYIDYYIVQLPRDETLVLQASTNQSPHLEFRKQVEFMIQRFALGPSEGTIVTPAASQP